MNTEMDIDIYIEMDTEIETEMDTEMDTEIDAEMNIENSLQVLFEQIASNHNRWNNLRQCRVMRVPPNIQEIQPGQYCELTVEGGGYFCQWYYYRTLDNRHMLIFRSPRFNDESFIYSGREINELPRSFDPYDNIVDTPEILIDSHISSFDELMDFDIRN